MAKRPTLTDVTSLTNSSAINTLNQNWDALETAFDNTLSLDGSTPNAMNADLDLNGNALLNVGTIDVSNLTLDGQLVTDIASVPEWRGAWVTATSYVKNDLVKTAGNVYICLISHTSAAAFSTDLTAVRWELMVSKGDSGAGTGDLLSTNNLSDLTDDATARSNLGLGSVATENTVPVAKGGTGATDAATARTNLGAQTAGATLDSLEGLSLAQGDLLYATAADTLQRLPKGVAKQALVMNSGATAPEWVSEWTYTSPATLSGTSQDWTGLPSTVTQIDIFLNALSMSGTDGLDVRLGTSGGFVSTGYVGTTSTIDGTSVSAVDITTAFNIFATTDADQMSGILHLYKGDSNRWFFDCSVRRKAGGISITGGTVDLGGTLTQVRIRPSVSNTFDNGTAYIRYK